MHLLLPASMFALAAASTAARAVEPDPCPVFLERLADVAFARGYEINVAPSEVRGSRGGIQLAAYCDAGQAGLDVFEYGGDEVHVEISGGAAVGHAFMLDAIFPRVGKISQTTMIDDGTEPLRGSLVFEASAGVDQAVVELDLESGTWTETGDAARVNQRFEAVLRDSFVWNDVHALIFAMPAGLGMLPGEELAVDALAVPASPAQGVDADLVYQKKACKAAGYVCAVAAVFHKLIPGCLGSALACYAAAKCVQEDCEGDGETTTG